MEVNSLYGHPYTTWGRRYNQFKWNDDWNIFLRIAEKERIFEDSHGLRAKPVNTVLAFLDVRILQRIGKDPITTLDVRIRVVCGLVNKISHMILSRELKLRFMDCIWDIYKQFSKDYIEYHCKYVLELPF